MQPGSCTQLALLLLLLLATCSAAYLQSLQLAELHDLAQPVSVVHLQLGRLLLLLRQLLLATVCWWCVSVQLSMRKGVRHSHTRPPGGPAAGRTA